MATFTKNIAQVLSRISIPFEFVAYKNPNSPQLASAFEREWDFVINIHFLANYYDSPKGAKVVNFIHGSEICLTSPNLIKHFYKRIFKHKFLDLLERAYLNVFISEFSQSVAQTQGLKLDYARDLIVHNGIDLVDVSTSRKLSSLSDERIIMSCIARDVPHKNIDGAVAFCEHFAKHTGKPVELVLPNGATRVSDSIAISYIGSADNERDALYRRAHFNLLFSKDCKEKGFFEGFGLVVLEAATFYTPTIGLAAAGLNESIHDNFTGWLVDEISEGSVRELVEKITPRKYAEVSEQCYRHTLSSHSLEVYEQLFGGVFSS